MLPQFPACSCILPHFPAKHVGRNAASHIFPHLPAFSRIFPQIKRHIDLICSSFEFQALPGCNRELFLIWVLVTAAPASTRRAWSETEVVFQVAGLSQGGVQHCNSRPLKPTFSWRARYTWSRGSHSYDTHTSGRPLSNTSPLHWWGSSVLCHMQWTRSLHMGSIAEFSVLIRHSAFA